MVALCLLCVATPAAAQEPAPVVGRNGERVTRLAVAELGAGQLIAGARLWESSEFLWRYERSAWPELLTVGVPTATLVTVALSSPDGITSALAQSINFGVLWFPVYAESAQALSDWDVPFDRARRRGRLWGVPLGIALGGLYYWAYEPTSGQVSAMHSVALLTTAWSVAYDDLALLPMAAPLVGALIGRAKPLSRRDVWIADGAALASGALWYLAAPASDDLRDQVTPLIATLAFTAAYILLPPHQPNADDPGTGFALSIVPGDAIAPVAGEQQGGFGLSASWAW